MARQLAPITIVTPGQWGLNLEDQNSLQEPKWASRADNCVIDGKGRISSRKGWTNLTSTPVTATPLIKTLHEQVGEDGTRNYIIAWDGGIGTSLSDPEGTDVSGAVTDTNGHWNFQNFNDKCIGFQDGQKPIVRTSGNFATVVESSGTAPTIADHVGLCAYGRVWGLDSNKQLIKFTALLDETNWGGAGSGSIDMSNIWTQGTDQVTAIAAFNGFFVVFGHHHIVIWEDTTGAQLGINPDNMIVKDVIEGTGTASWNTIRRLGESELVYLGSQGVQLLSRVVQEKSTPLDTLSSKVQTEFLEDFNGIADADQISTAVDPSRGYYIVSFHDQLRTWVFHYNRAFQDPESGRPLVPVTNWDLISHTWLWDTGSARLLLGGAGVVGVYGTVDSDNGTAYSMEYETSWLALGEGLGGFLKILKNLGSILLVQSATTVSYRWDFDFAGAWSTTSVVYTAGSQAEWGEAEWSLGEWAGAAQLRIKRLPAHGTGQYIKLALSATVASEIALQQLEVFAKLGRMT